MPTLIGIAGGRSWPPGLVSFLASADLRLQTVDPRQADWAEALPAAEGVLLLSPAWTGAHYLSHEQLWWRFLRDRWAALRLLSASFRPAVGSNQLDLLALPDAARQWWELTATVQDQPSPPTSGGINLMEKLQRFFSGHGDDSIIAVLNRLRFVIQTAEREVTLEQTPFEEVFRDLLSPARLADKWAEWRNRWVNYAPLFRWAPFAADWQQLETDLRFLEAWMAAGGTEAEPLASGRILQHLNRVSTQLYQIAQTYVDQESPHSDRR